MPKTKKPAKSRDGVSYLGLDDQNQRRFLVRYSVTANGVKREREKTIVASDKADALARRKALAEELRAELMGSAGGETIDTLIAQWKETLVHATRLTYGSHIKHVERAIGTRRITEVKTQELQRLFAELPTSDNTANCVRKATLSLFRWAKEKGLIAVNVAADTVKRSTPLTQEERWRRAREVPLPRHMLPDQLARFVHAFETKYPETFMVLTTQLMLGCRIGEAIALEWEDIDFVSGRVIIRNNFHRGQLGAPKDGEARETALGPHWRERLLAHRARLVAEGRRGVERFCFPSPYQTDEAKPYPHYWAYSTIREHFHEVKDACGIRLASRAVTHSLRHTMSSLAQQDNQELIARRFLDVSVPRSGGSPSDLQRALGHASPEMTERYVHVNQAQLIDFAREVEKRVPLRRDSKVGPQVGDQGGTAEKA